MVFHHRDQVSWRPGQLSDQDVSAEEVGKNATNVNDGGVKKQAYKPPKAGTEA